MNDQSDTDTQETATGVGGQQSPVSALHSTHPGWISDGLGIRGPQRYTSSEKATPSPMNFGMDSGARNSSGSPSSGGQLSVTDESVTVDNVNLITFDGDLFTVSDEGGGEVRVTLQTTDCSS